MDNGHPLTVFMVTALILWALYLWHQHRLGVIRPQPAAPAAVGPIIGPPAPPIGPPAVALAPPTFTPGIAPAPSSAPSITGG